MKIEPGKFGVKTFGPGAPDAIATEVNDWIAKHDLERYPIQTNNFSLAVEPERGVVLTVVFVLTNPTDEERKRGAAMKARANGITVGG